MSKAKEVEKVTKAYEEKFGGYPAFLLMGATDDEIITKLKECIETGKELEPDEQDAYY